MYNVTFLKLYDHTIFVQVVLVYYIIYKYIVDIKLSGVNFYTTLCFINLFSIKLSLTFGGKNQCSE